MQISAVLVCGQLESISRIIVAMSPYLSDFIRLVTFADRPSAVRLDVIGSHRDAIKTFWSQRFLPCSA